MKTYYRLIVLVLSGCSFITAAQAQLRVEAEGLYIKAGTTLSADSLVLSPSADLTLSGLSIEKSTAPVTGNSGSGIKRSYNFSVPITFSGTLGFYYSTSDLNNNGENLLQLAYKSSSLPANYTATAGSSVNTTTKYIENTFTSTGLSTLSAANPAIFTSTNANLTALVLSSGTLLPVFTSGTANYTASVGNSVSSLTVNATRDEANATITVNGATVSSGISASIPLNVGSNTLTTVVTAQDGTTTKTYTLTIVRLASQTITFNTPSKTYGDASFALPETASSGLAITYVSDNTSVADINGNIVTLKNAGVAKITASQAGNSIYETAVSAEHDLTVSKKPVTITAAAKSKIYSEADPALTYTLTIGALVGTDTLTGGLTRDSGENSGIYAIKQGSLSLNSNYELNYTAANLEITKKAVAITAIAKNKIYGEADPALTYLVTAGALAGSDTFTGSLSRDAGENAGSYSIKQGSLSPGSNYELTYTAANLEISKKAVTITATAKNKIYGEADPALTYLVTAGALAGSDTFTGSLSRDAGENVGNYSIKQGTLSPGLNYSLTYTAANLEITKRQITVAAGAKSKIYGETDPALTYSVTAGFLAGSDNFTGSLSRDAGENAGNYSINQGTLILNSNYNLSYTGAGFIINKRDLTIVADNKSKTYGDINPPLTATYSGLVNGDTAISLSAILTTSAITASAAGNYTIEPNATSSNYTITFTKGILAVSKKQLTVTAENKTRLQNTANPPLTATYNGFIAGENENNLSTKAVISTTANLLSVAGTYPITVSGAASGNYSFNYLPAILTISPGIPTSLDFAAENLYENAPSGSLAGFLSSASNDPSATFTYSFANGTGGSDNNLFTITGNQIKTVASLDFEQKAAYAVRIRSTTQQNLFLEKELIINLTDVNEQPTLANIPDQAICYTTSRQAVAISGVTAGPDAGQSTTLSVSTSNNTLFESLEINQSNTSGNAVLNYKLSKETSGSAVINVMVADNGGTANGGINNILKSFTIQVNPLPQVAIVSDKGTSLSKGETALLTATGTGTYQWKSAMGILGGQNTARLTVRPEETTIYTVQVTNVGGCASEQEITITVNNDFEMISGTNIMSPNGDGVNDHLIIKNIDMYPKNEVKIFDRGGRLVYSQKNYTDQWNGTLNGSPLAADTYYYIVDFGPGLPKKKGFISIVKD